MICDAVMDDFVSCECMRSSCEGSSDICRSAEGGVGQGACYVWPTIYIELIGVCRSEMKRDADAGEFSRVVVCGR